jgi:hypothetical protein
MHKITELGLGPDLEFSTINMGFEIAPPTKVCFNKTRDAHCDG